MTGMPSGRCFPVAPLFGIHTRLTGRACHGSAGYCTRSTSSAFAAEDSTTSPSTPAVLRPALISVTRRTLSSVLARERSINFCKLRTLLRSPACVAVKILCRRRRTSSSTWRQSMLCQSRSLPSGPFTTATRARAAAAVDVVMVPNLSFGSGVVVSCSARAHLTRVGTLSGRAIALSGQLSATVGRGADHHRPGFLLPFGHRHSLLGSSAARQGIRASLTVGLPAATSRRTLTGLPRSTHTRCGRGGCLLYPGDGGAHPIDHKSSTGACRFPAASPYTPLKQPINEAADNETSTEVHAIHPSGLALTCDPRMERGPSGLNSELRTPPSPAAHVRAGTGHLAPARNYATDISRPSCLRVHSQRATSCRNLKYCFTRLCR